jgi:hypothetical protein
MLWTSSEFRRTLIGALFRPLRTCNSRSYGMTCPGRAIQDDKQGGLPITIGYGKARKLRPQHRVVHWIAIALPSLPHRHIVATSSPSRRRIVAASPHRRRIVAAAGRQESSAINMVRQRPLHVGGHFGKPRQQTPPLRLGHLGRLSETRHARSMVHYTKCRNIRPTIPAPTLPPTHPSTPYVSLKLVLLRSKICF